MAWHSGKPADSDFLSASVRHIRENFAELEPLQPHVAELVDLTALHPHIAALLDSRIVEMGSNSNGEYVRWENGLQVCWNLLAETRSTTTATGPLYRDDAATMWTFPAAFITFPVLYGTVSRSTDDDYRLFFAPHSVTTTSVTYRDVSTGSSGSLGRTDRLLAIGRWK